MQIALSLRALITVADLIAKEEVDSLPTIQAKSALGNTYSITDKNIVAFRRLSETRL